MNPPKFSNNNTEMEFNGLKFRFDCSKRDCKDCDLYYRKRPDYEPHKTYSSACSRFSQDEIFDSKKNMMPKVMRCEYRDDGQHGVWIEVENTTKVKRLPKKRKPKQQDPFEAEVLSIIL